MEADKRLELVAARSSTSPPGSTASRASDIVIDPLAMPIGADTSVVNTTLETMRRIRDEHGLNMTCGASNVSFGMPDRHTLGAAFLPMAMTAGLTSAIMDTRTPQIVDAVKAADLLLGPRRVGHGSWIAAHRKKQAATDLMAEGFDGPPDFEVDALRREGLIDPPDGPGGLLHDGSAAWSCRSRRRGVRCGCPPG